MEGRVSSDQDLKLGDTFRYYQRDSHAAKALLVRRLRCLAAYETANRNLERARAKNKDVHAVSTFTPLQMRLFLCSLNITILFSFIILEALFKCTLVTKIRIYSYYNAAAHGSTRGTYFLNAIRYSNSLYTYARPLHVDPLLLGFMNFR